MTIEEVKHKVKLLSKTFREGKDENYFIEYIYDYVKFAFKVHKKSEKEIINALSINAIVDWESNETSPNEEFKYLKKFVRKLFRLNSIDLTS